MSAVDNILSCQGRTGRLLINGMVLRNRQKNMIPKHGVMFKFFHHVRIAAEGEIDFPLRQQIRQHI